jgi:hypothetical protein
MFGSVFPPHIHYTWYSAQLCLKLVCCNSYDFWDLSSHKTCLFLSCCLVTGRVCCLSWVKTSHSNQKQRERDLLCERDSTQANKQQQQAFNNNWDRRPRNLKSAAQSSIAGINCEPGSRRLVRRPRVQTGRRSLLSSLHVHAHCPALWPCDHAWGAWKSEAALVLIKCRRNTIDIRELSLTVLQHDYYNKHFYSRSSDWGIRQHRDWLWPRRFDGG